MKFQKVWQIRRQKSRPKPPLWILYYEFSENRNTWGKKWKVFCNILAAGQVCLLTLPLLPRQQDMFACKHLSYLGKNLITLAAGQVWLQAPLLSWQQGQVCLHEPLLPWQQGKFACKDELLRQQGKFACKCPVSLFSIYFLHPCLVS